MSDDFPSDSGKEKWILIKAIWFPLPYKHSVLTRLGFWGRPLLVPLGTFWSKISIFPSSIVNIGDMTKKQNKKVGTFHVSKFPLSFFCLPFSALVFLLSLCFSTSCSPKNCPPDEVFGGFLWVGLLTGRTAPSVPKLLHYSTWFSDNLFWAP